MVVWKAGHGQSKEQVEEVSRLSWQGMTGMVMTVLTPLLHRRERSTVQHGARWKK